MFTKIPSRLDGCFEVVFTQKDDNRGHFIKSYHVDMCHDLGIDMPIKEEYFTTSQKNVFRGLHFQHPPKAIAKMVYCVQGQVCDYVVDIRANSPTYGQYHVFELNSNKPSMVYVPEGFAHGFYVVSDSALMQYKVSDVFDAACDAGIDYRSFGFAQDIVNPIMSDRDKNFVAFKDFKSLFV
jgi:dTDP-4-dehydrorhamnose 3,5-epimerase